MAINFYYNGTYSLAEYPSTDAVATNASARLNYVKNGTTYCAVASTTNATNAPICTIGNLQYLGDCSSPTVHFVKNGTTYHCAKSTSSRTVDIPAGEYSVWDFSTLITKKLGTDIYSTGTWSRQLASPVTITQNGKSATWSVIYFCADYNKWSARISNKSVSAICYVDGTLSVLDCIAIVTAGNEMYGCFNHPVTVHDDIIFV